MSGSATAPTESPAPWGADATRAGATAWSRRRQAAVIRACLRGDEAAWAALLNQFQKLIYSIPLRAGLGADAAADIFQAVCLELWRGLASLRRREALGAWLIQTTARHCWRWRKQSGRWRPLEEAPPRDLAATDPALAEALAAAQQEDALRRALARLRPRDRALLEMLFLSDPPRPYAEAARTLGLAVGSLGWMRRDGLRRLRDALRAEGVAGL